MSTDKIGSPVKTTAKSRAASRWLEALGSGLHTRDLESLRRQAGRAVVHALEIGHGRVAADVSCTGESSFHVAMSVPVLDDAVWDRANDAIAANPAELVKLMAGDCSEGLEQVCADAGLDLFPGLPAIDGWVRACRCTPLPCVHTWVLVCAVANSLEDDPWQLFRIRGRKPEEIFTYTYRAWGWGDGQESAPVSHPVAEVSTENFYNFPDGGRDDNSEPAVIPDYHEILQTLGMPPGISESDRALIAQLGRNGDDDK